MRRRALRTVALLVVLLLAASGAVLALRDRSHVTRSLVWRDADVDDYRRFPSRAIAAAPDPTPLPTEPQVTDALPDEQFLADTETTAFLVLRNGVVEYEGYFNGYDRESTQTSMSVAKSFLSALVGIAIEQGHIGSVDDPVTDYVPELLDRDRRLERITLRHLLTMTSGLRYTQTGTPWGDDAATYYAPDLRALAMERTEVVEEPGTGFSYNNYNPLLLGLVLERATGVQVATYLEQVLWQPLGIEAGASWSLDSDRSGFEKLESGLNARAVDFARFGALWAAGGRWGDRQVVPRAWVEDPTLVPTRPEAPAPAYQFFWWVQDDREPRAVFALGNYGQLVYVVPSTGTVLVRFGRDFGHPDWPGLLGDIAHTLDGTG